MFFKWATPGLFLLIFVLLSVQYQLYKLKKRRWCAWDSNLQLHDCRRYHGAMADAPGQSMFGHRWLKQRW